MNPEVPYIVSRLPCPHGAYRTAAVLLLLLAAGGCTQENRTVRIYAMGERAEAGPLIYNVLESEWRARLGEGAQVRIPQHRFLLLRLSITNSGANTVSAPRVALVARSGAEYDELTDSEGVDDWLGLLRRLKPAETAVGRVLFDAPRGDYQLRVSDDAFDPADARLAMIQIPLRMEAKSDFLPERKPDR